MAITIVKTLTSSSINQPSGVVGLDASSRVNLNGATAAANTWLKVRCADNDFAFVAVDEANLPLILSYSDAGIGRIGLSGYDGDGGIMVLSRVGAGVAQARMGHYAFTGADSASNYSTLAFVSAHIAVPTPGATSSSIRLYYASAVDATTGYKQPNKYAQVGTAGFSIQEGAYTLPTGLKIYDSPGIPDFAAPRGSLSLQTNGAWRNTTGTAGGWVLAFGTVPDLGLVMTGVSGEYASTPDSAATSITGDIDVRVRLRMADWTPGVFQVILAKGSATGNFSYQLGINGGGTIQWGSSHNGVALSLLNSTAIPTTIPNGELWIRFTMDVSDGSGNYVRTFYTSDNGVDWTLLGSVNTSVGTASIFNSTHPVELGGQLAGTTDRFTGNIIYAELRNGIAGTVVAKFDPTTDGGVLGGTSFTSSTGETWTLNGGLVLEYA